MLGFRVWVPHNKDCNVWASTLGLFTTWPSWNIRSTNISSCVAGKELKIIKLL